MAIQIDENDIKITICKGDCSHIGSAEVGVKLVHRPTNITVYSLKKKSQHANKVAALELLKMELVKRRFENIDEGDLVDGEIFWKDLDSGKYD